MKYRLKGVMRSLLFRAVSQVTRHEQMTNEIAIREENVESHGLGERTPR